MDAGGLPRQDEIEWRSRSPLGAVPAQLKDRASTIMMTSIKSWFQENHTLVYFLVAQAIAIGAAVLSVTAYMVRLESRVNTLEVRGSPHLAEINNRLTVLESLTKTNKDSLDRVVDIMTKNLSVNPAPVK
jgi:hypothetical protein